MRRATRRLTWMPLGGLLAMACGRVGFDPLRVSAGLADADRPGETTDARRPPANPPGDADTGSDRPSPTEDTAPPTDGSLPTDGAPPADAPASVDAPLPKDGPAPLDGATTPDAPPVADRLPVDLAPPIPDMSVDAPPRPPDAACVTPWPPASGLLAEWRANGNTDNRVACSPWQAQVEGTVPYGAGKEGSAWWFRSMQMSQVGDPDWVSFTPPNPSALDALTLDVWVRPEGFNAYPASNRIIVATTWAWGSGQPAALIYRHENAGYYFYVATGAGNVSDVDYSTCNFDNPGVPDATWTRLTATFDGKTLTCYVNGAWSTAGRVTAKQAIPILDGVIGRNFAGDVDAVRIFNRALSETEAAAAWP